MHSHPHKYSTVGGHARGVDIFCDNLRRFLQLQRGDGDGGDGGGEPLVNAVDWARGY